MYYLHNNSNKYKKQISTNKQEKEEEEEEEPIDREVGRLAGGDQVGGGEGDND